MMLFMSSPCAWGTGSHGGRHAMHDRRMPTVPFFGGPCQDPKPRHDIHSLPPQPGSSACVVRGSRRLLVGLTGLGVRPSSWGFCVAPGPAARASHAPCRREAARPCDGANRTSMYCLLAFFGILYSSVYVVLINYTRRAQEAGMHPVKTPTPRPPTPGETR